MPLQRTRVIPTGWSGHHRPVVAGTFTATCAIRRPGGVPGVFDPETGETPTTAHDPHYTGGCRVQVLPSLEQEAVTGDQEVTTVGYRVSIGYNVTPDLAVGDLVKVTAVDDNGDPTLVDRSLRVESFSRGSLMWERDLVCIDDLG